MIQNELSGCASPGLSLLPAHPLSLAFSLPPAHLPKDPGSQPLIQFHPRAHIDSDSDHVLTLGQHCVS